MKLLKNTGSDRVIDGLRQTPAPQSPLDFASPAFSLFAFAEMRELLDKLGACRAVLPTASGMDLGLTGTEADRAFRNRLQVRWLASECAAWLSRSVEIRGAPAMHPQSILIAGRPESELHRVITGNCPLTTAGLGITPGDQYSLIQCAEGAAVGCTFVCSSKDPRESHESEDGCDDCHWHRKAKHQQ